MPNDILENLQVVNNAKDILKNILESKVSLTNAEIAETVITSNFPIDHVVSTNSDFSSHSIIINGYKSASDAAQDDISKDVYNKYHSTGHGLVGVGAGTAMVGASGVGVGQGIATGRAAEAVGRNPQAENKIRSTFIIGAAISESSALYSLVVAILLLFVF